MELDDVNAGRIFPICSHDDISTIPQILTHKSASQLHSDILLCIFFLLRDMHSHDMYIVGLGRFVKVNWTWLSVTKVCKYWRHVALECPGLWVDIYCFDELDEFRAFLERSGEAEIKVRLIISHIIFQPEISRLLSNHMWRVREIRVTVLYQGWDFMESCLDKLSERAKAVELTQKVGYFGMITDQQRIKIPALKLDSLSLNSVRLPWSSPLFHGLSQLSIANKLDAANVPTIWQLIEILEHCPRLRQLALKGVHPLISNTDITTLEERRSRLELSFLESIVLSDLKFPICAYLFDILTIDENVHLSLSITDYPFRSPLPVPRRLLEGRRECECIMISIQDTDLKLFITISDGNISSSITKLYLEITSTPIDFVTLISAIRNILTHPSWRTAKIISLSFHDVMTLLAQESEWIIFLEGLPKSTKKLSIQFSPENIAYLNNWDTHSLLRSLAPFQSAEGAGMQATVRLPELEQLIIHNADFSTEHGEIIYRYSIQIMEERNRYTIQKCEVRFFTCKGASTEAEAESGINRDWSSSRWTIG